MEDNTEKCMVDVEAYAAQKSRMKSFEFYEEYSRKDINETMKSRRENFEKADEEGRRQLENKVEAEVANFRRWLEESKKLDPTTAHYCSVSLKSLLLGLQQGTQVSQLFDIILNR